MPYQRNRAISGMTEKSKLHWILALSFLAIVIALIVFYAINPRDFLQTFTNEHSYANIVVAKNADRAEKAAKPTLSYLSGKKAWQTEGSTDWTLSSSAADSFGSRSLASQFQDAVNGLTFDGTTQMQSGRMVGRYAISDVYGPVLNTEMSAGGGHVDLNTAQLMIGWHRISADSTASRLLQPVSLDSRARRALNSPRVQRRIAKDLRRCWKDMQKDVSVSEEDNCSFYMPDKRADGDRLTIVLTQENLHDFVENAFWEMKEDGSLYRACNRELGSRAYASREAFTRAVYSIGSAYLQRLEETGISGVSFDLCINRKNQIEACNVLVKMSDGSDGYTVNTILEDAYHRGPALKVQKGENQIFAFTANSSEHGSGTGTIQFGSGAQTTVHWLKWKMDHGLPTGEFHVDPFTIPGLESYGSIQIDWSCARHGEQKTWHHSGTITSGRLGKFVCSLDVSETDYELMKIPFSGEVTKPSRQKMQDAWNRYLLQSLPQVRPKWKSFVSGLNSVLRQQQAQPQEDGTAAETAGTASQEIYQNSY